MASRTCTFSIMVVLALFVMTDPLWAQDAGSAADSVAADAPGSAPAFEKVMKFCGNSVYFFLALMAVFGTYYAILLFRRIRQKSFPSFDESYKFLTATGDLLRAQRYDDALKLCQTPQYWRVAVPQVVALAIQSRKDDIGRIRRTVIGKFDDIINDMDHTLSYISAIIRMAPLAGLLGTVLGMIAAFSRLGDGGDTVDAGALAGDVSLALWTTAVGVLVATPFILVGNAINVRIRKLETNTQDSLMRFMEDFERSPAVAQRRRTG